MTARILFFLVIVCLISFEELPSKGVVVSKHHLDSLVRLGNTGYTLKLPKEFTMVEPTGRGKEGQLIYDIFSKDSSGWAAIHFYNRFIEVDKNKAPVETIDANFLGKKVKWRLVLEEDYYWAEIMKEKVYARASSKNRDEVYKMISVISTLNK